METNELKHLDKDDIDRLYTELEKAAHRPRREFYTLGMEFAQVMAFENSQPDEYSIVKDDDDDDNNAWTDQYLEEEEKKSEKKRIREIEAQHLAEIGNEIPRYKAAGPLTMDTMLAITEIYRGDSDILKEDAYNLVLCAFKYWLLDKVRRQYPKTVQDRQDLMQVALKAVLTALPKYDATSGNRIETFLRTRVQHAVSDERAEQAESTRHKQMLAKYIRKATASLMQRGNTKPSARELSAEIAAVYHQAISEKQILKIQDEEYIKVDMSAAENHAYSEFADPVALLLKNEQTAEFYEKVRMLDPMSRSLVMMELKHMQDNGKMPTLEALRKMMQELHPGISGTDVQAVRSGAHNKLVIYYKASRNDTENIHINGMTAQAASLTEALMDDMAAVNLDEFFDGSAF